MLPYSLELLSDRLKGIHVPAEPFDPNGEWVHDYSIWNSARAVDAKSERLGSLRIHRRLMPNGNIRLQVTEVAMMPGPKGSGVMKAGVSCKADDLCTPIQWKTDSDVLDPQGKEVPLTAIGVSNRADKLKASGRLSSNWSLFDVVQRLPFDSKTIEFTLLDELALVKPDQKLSAGQTAEVELGGRMVKLHSFEQIGRGILPITYWLDDQHRLIIATGGRRSYLLDSVGGGTK
jgi:hypothetical protein